MTLPTIAPGLLAYHRRACSQALAISLGALRGLSSTHATGPDALALGNQYALNCRSSLLKR